jgi:hypothetical protein
MDIEGLDLLFQGESSSECEFVTFFADLHIWTDSSYGTRFETPRSDQVLQFSASPIEESFMESMPDTVLPTPALLAIRP